MTLLSFQGQGRDFTIDLYQHWAACVLDPSLPLSVQLAHWPQGPAQDPDLLARWQRLLQVREVVMAALERAKNEGAVPKPLEAHIDLYASPEALGFLETFGQALPRLFVVSSVQLHESGGAPVEIDEHAHVGAIASPASGGKCVRCWIRDDTVGQSQDHTELCARCVQCV